MSSPDSMAWRAAAGVADLWAPDRLAILIFHRVLPEPDPLFPGEMHAARFDALMARVARGFNVLTLAQALERRRLQQLPPRALVITFDDGYADNADIALPILERHGLKASFFVASGFLDGGRMWNDSAIEIIRGCRERELDASDLGLGLLPLGDATQRRRAIDAVLPRLKYSPLAEREQGLAALAKAAGHPALPDDLMMSTQKLRRLHRAGMEIGGHTRDHPILRVLPDADAREQIVGGRERLQDLLQAPVTSFAYPNGRPGHDYDHRHVAMVREAGFAGAVSTAQGVDDGSSDRFQLPRFTPWDTGMARWMVRLLLQRVRPAPTEVAAATAAA
jgi:peptidoglycan/xylan/chitin deacetylase (PgdA/CDA1 family)